jgi:catechol 2,3-dioxygenase-like lactoylglutathione lyase family enzyme
MQASSRQRQDSTIVDPISTLLMPLAPTKAAGGIQSGGVLMTDVNALPGLRGVDHIGFTVPDLDAASEFLSEVLGCEYMYSIGPFERDDDWMQQHMNVPAGTVMRELRFFRCGGQAIFEVFAYEAPRRCEQVPLNSDVGGHHVALYVEDLDAAVAYLRSRGVRVLAEPTTSSGPSEGQRWVYFLAPWGMQFELVSYPHGKAYDNGTWPARSTRE